MGSVWKRLNRINKRASKYKFTASYQELYLEAGPSWQPNYLSVVWTRRGRRVVADPVAWEPTMKSPYIGMCVWPVADCKEITVTLFRDQRQEEYDNKDWFFILEDVRESKRKPIAQGRLNLKDFAKQIPHQENLRIKLRPLSKKVTACYLTLTITSEFIKEGKATDDDMRSVASLVSNSTIHNDIADLDTLQEEDDQQEEDTIAVPVSEFEALTKSIQSMNQKLDNINPDVIPVRTLPSKPVHSSVTVVAEDRVTSTLSPPVKDLSRLSTASSENSYSVTSENSSLVSNTSTVILAPKAPPRKLSTDSSNKISSTETPNKQHDTPTVISRTVISVENTPKSEKAAVVSELPSGKKDMDKSEGLSSVKPIESSFEESIEETSTSLIEIDGEVVETKAVTTEKRAEKIQKTKSQELREFTQEFVRSTVVDFDPMSFEDHTPTVIRSSMRKVEVKRDIPPTSEGDKAFISSDTTPPNSKEKQEIVPSDSFLNSINREGSSSSSSEATPSDPNQNTMSNNTNLKDFKSMEPVRNLVSSETSPVPLSSLTGPAAPATPASSAAKSNAPKDMKGSTKSDNQPTDTKLDLKRGVGASSDLLEWSKSILAKYQNVKVTNFTTSWRNGLAFCALIHNFYPDLLEYESLTAHDIKHNNKVAFEAGEKLGIPRVLEPENMAIKKIPDKLAVITYLHQLRSSLGTPETNELYESTKMDANSTNGSAIRKSFSEGNIKFFARTTSIDVERTQKELPTVLEEGGNGEIPVKPASKYRQKAKDLMEAARRESTDKSSSASPERENTPPNVIRRQKSVTPKPKPDNRLSYIDNELKFLDAEQMEIDRQAAILDKRLRETSEDDQLVYDALLQQWFTLVNKKNALLRRQMQLNILEKEDDLEKRSNMLQNELRTYTEMEESKKTEEDKQREELLLQELVLVVNQRNELVLQRDEEERMIENDEQIEQDVILPEDRLVQNRGRVDECKMQ